MLLLPVFLVFLDLSLEILRYLVADCEQYPRISDTLEGKEAVKKKLTEMLPLV